ncbi:MAG: rplW [Candidatus Parcubacteria bacterium]|nr:rplW [Candidatus Parcubacteria bacterium]
MFWSKKSKADKNYSEAAAPAKAKNVGSKNAPAKARVAKSTAAKAVKAPKKSQGRSGGSEVVLSTGTPSASFIGADAILRPHITEKAGQLAQNNVYTFQVSKDANKPTIAKAIFSLYKVKPTKIAVINLPSKNVFVKGRWGVVSGTRKAMVTLKKGDKIDFV